AAASRSPPTWPRSRRAAGSASSACASAPTRWGAGWRSRRRRARARGCGRASPAPRGERVQSRRPPGWEERTVAATSPDLSIGSDQLGVLTTTRRVVEQSRYVHVDEATIASLAPGLARRLQRPRWDSQGLPVDETERTPNLLLVLDALNFSF